MNEFLFPIISIGGIGLLFGAILSYAGEKLKVEEDPNIALVRDVLPGANCGGCGYTGCDAFAAAVASGAAPTNGCPVGGEKCANAVASVLGIEPIVKEREVAFVKCAGSCEKASSNYEYYGVEDCNMAAKQASGTSKTCTYGCMGGGSCVRACEFDAIHIIDGISFVDKDKCVACGKCIPTCPKSLIEFVPYKNEVLVNCNSNANGKVVKEGCSVGCIGCKMCERACEFDAVHVDNFLAKIDYNKCTQCNACALKCPTKAIKGLNTATPTAAPEAKQETEATNA